MPGVIGRLFASLKSANWTAKEALLSLVVTACVTSDEGAHRCMPLLRCKTMPIYKKYATFAAVDIVSNYLASSEVRNMPLVEVIG
jgi:hypothetical protein